ncbi:unnamed protein product [Chrysoparadoxa australica]
MFQKGAVMLDRTRKGFLKSQKNQPPAEAQSQPLLVDIEEGQKALSCVVEQSHGDSPEGRRKAAVELAAFVKETRILPSSFPPVAHALRRLVPSEDRTTASHAARATKVLVLDEELRHKAVAAGIHYELVEAMRLWSEEVPCLIEILGAVQTLCYDGATVQALVRAGILQPLLEELSCSDPELQRLTLATAANILAFADSVFLTDEACINLFVGCMEEFFQAAERGEPLSRLYAVSAIANASTHPVLSSRIRELGGVALLEKISNQEHQKKRGGWTTRRLIEGTELTIDRLTGLGIESDLMRDKFCFKWGLQAQRDLARSRRNRRIRFGAFGAVWALSLLWFFNSHGFNSGGE